MTTFKVIIPDNKKSFFLEVLKLLGAQYKEEGKEDVFELSDEQKGILDKQETLDLTEYQDNDDFLKEIKEEYGL